MHTSTLTATWRRQQSQLRVLQHELSDHTCSCRAVEIRLDRLREQAAIPPRCQPPLLSACRALGLSVGVLGKFSQPVPQPSQGDLRDEHDTRSAFPSYLSKS